MNAISLWQPWAHLYVLGYKKVETRNWGTKIRGEMAVHAALKTEHMGTIFRGEFWTVFKEYLIERGVQVLEPSGYDSSLGFGLGTPIYKDTPILPTGAIVGKVNLVDCVPIQKLYGTEYDTERERQFGDWRPGRYGWIAESPVVFDIPYKLRGRQGIFQVDMPQYLCAHK